MAIRAPDGANKGFDIVDSHWKKAISKITQELVSFGSDYFSFIKSFSLYFSQYFAFEKPNR